MRISKQSSLFWKCQRYHFVTGYELKPLLAPPFVIISLIYMIAKYLVRLCQKKKIKFDRKLKSFLSEDMIQRLHDFEENCFYIYRCELEDLTDNQLEEKVKHTRNKVESISSRIDDIFFKESMTKLSLYKVELRLQKLEECTVETLGLLNNLGNLFHANKPLPRNIEQSTFFDRPRTLSSRHRHNTITDTSYYANVANHLLSRQVSRSSMRGIRSNSNAGDENQNMVFNSWEGKDRNEQTNRDNLREESLKEEANYSSEQNIVSKEIKMRRKKMPNESQSAVVHKSAKSRIGKLEKNSDNEEENNEEMCLIKNDLLDKYDDPTEAKYFEHFSKCWQFFLGKY